MGANLNFAALASAAALLAATAAEADIVHVQATLKSAAPAAATHGKGQLAGVLDSDRNVLEYTVTYAGLSGPVVTAGFRPAASDPSDPVVTAPAADKTGAIHAVVTLSNAQVNDLLAGRWVFDVRTGAAPNGELEGSVRRTSNY